MILHFFIRVYAVAEGGRPPSPLARLASRAELVPCAFADDFPLELVRRKGGNVEVNRPIEVLY